jgi:tRNA (cytidine/uridine-2'-O-)-methyltransferase
MLKIALFEPEIPPNTGNIIRLAANTGCELHLIEPLGFSLDEKSVRRSGMDYREVANVQVHPDWEAFLKKEQPKTISAISTKGATSLFEHRFEQDQVVVFGPETRGLSEQFRSQFDPDQILHIPMQEGSRSLNLSNAAAVVVYEAWRQLDFKK